MYKLNLNNMKKLLSIISVVLAMAAVIMGINYLYKELTWEQNAEKLIDDKISGQINLIQKIIVSLQKLPQDLAYVLEFSNVDEKRIKILLEAVLANNEEAYGSCIAFEKGAFIKDSASYAPYLYKNRGELVFTNLNSPEYDYFNADWYLITKRLNKPVWIGPYYDEGGGNELMATYAVPFYSFDGKREKFRGVVTVDVSIKWLTEIFSSIEIFKKGYTLLLSEDGTIISSPKREWIFNQTIFSLAEELKMPVVREIGRKLQRGESGFLNLGRTSQGNLLIYYKFIPVNKWAVIYIVYK